MYESLVARVRYHIQKANFMGLKEAESTLLLAEAAEGGMSMGIYINMELPNNCINCAARHGAECWLADCSYIPNYHKERPKWCPLVHVPAHGRTIDAAALWVEINKICDRRDAGIISDLTCVQQLLSAVRHAPTVIPAEPKEEGMKSTKN